MNLFPFLAMIMIIDDLTAAVKSPGLFQFGWPGTPKGSIFTSQAWYVAFRVVQLFMLAAFVSLSFYRHQLRKAFIAVIVLNILLFLYPMLTARN